MTPGRVYRRGGRYWLAYSRDGRLYRESARTADPAAAHALLAQRLQYGTRNGFEHSRNVSRETFDAAVVALEADYAVNRRHSLSAVRSRVAHLRAFFAENASVSLASPTSITAYINARLTDGAARATVNRELAALKRACKLAGLALPQFSMLREDNARQGFVSRDALDRVIAALPEHLRDPVLFLYYSSWRPSEMRSLLWSDVEFETGGSLLPGSRSRLTRDSPKSFPEAAHGAQGEPATSQLGSSLAGSVKHAASGIEFLGSAEGGCPAADRPLPLAGGAHPATTRSPEIRLRPERSKNGRGRVLPLAGDLLLVLTRAAAARLPAVPFVFHHHGRPLRDFRRAWATATRAAGVPELLLYDLRRSAIRNFVRAGVPERVAMALSGHLTRSTFDRYNIVSGEDLRVAMEKTCQ